MIRSAPTKVLPLSYSGSYSLVMVLMVLLALTCKLLIFPFNCPDMRGPIVSTPKVTATPMSRYYYSPWDPQFPVTFVSLDRRGQIYVDRKIVLVALLRDELGESLKRTSKPYFYLTADTSLSFGKILGVLNVARTLGVDHVALIVEY